MVLVNRLIHDRDLALAKSVVQRGVHGLGRQAEARCRIAVDDHIGRQAGILLVGTHVRNLRQSREFIQESRPPYGQRVEIGPLQRVLVLRVALPAADAHVLGILQEHGGPRHARSLAAQTGDHLV